MEEIIQLELGALGTNCYILAGTEGRAVVIDPASCQKVISYLEKNSLTLGAILVTHGHFDHFSGVDDLLKYHKAETIVSDPDKEMFLDPFKCWADFLPFTPFVPLIADRTYHDGEEFDVCGISFRMMSSKGHTAGSGLLFVKMPGSDKEFIIAGDTVFRGSVGRSDGYSGSRTEQREALRRIAQLQGDYTIYCGHGPSTTLAYEQMFNPYIQEAMR